jgi:hypothetical protein
MQEVEALGGGFSDLIGWSIHIQFGDSYRAVVTHAAFISL